MPKNVGLSFQVILRQLLNNYYQTKLIRPATVNVSEKNYTYP